MGLTVALAKGRLADKAMDLFVRAGVTCPAMKETMDETSRRLVFSSEEADLSFFMAKAPDVPTYVDYGAADVGVAGKDTLLEEGRHLYEVLDLRFGACRMVVAVRIMEPPWDRRGSIMYMCCRRASGWVGALQAMVFVCEFSV